MIIRNTLLPQSACAGQTYKKRPALNNQKYLQVSPPFMNELRNAYKFQPQTFVRYPVPSRSPSRQIVVVCSYHCTALSLSIVTMSEEEAAPTVAAATTTVAETEEKNEEEDVVREEESSATFEPVVRFV